MSLTPSRWNDCIEWTGYGAREEKGPIIITGFPRSGTSLLLLLCAGSVKNKAVKYESEQVKWGASKDHICKCPFAAIRRGDDLVYPVFMIRHPMAVLTSRHKSFPGYYGFHWTKGKEKGKKQAPYGLRTHYDHLGYPRFRYEDLTRDPDSIQEQIGNFWGLEYDRKWSTWPWDDFDVPRYWKRTGLGDVRPIEPAREWDGKERIDILTDELREAIHELGYSVNPESKA